MRVLLLIQQTSNQNRTKRQKTRFLVPALRAGVFLWDRKMAAGVSVCLCFYSRTHSIDLPVLSRLLDSNWSYIARFPGRTAHSLGSLEMLVLANHVGQTFLPHIHEYLYNHIFRHTYIISIFLRGYWLSERIWEKKCYLEGSLSWIKLNLLRWEGGKIRATDGDLWMQNSEGRTDVPLLPLTIEEQTGNPCQPRRESKLFPNTAENETRIRLWPP